MCVGEPRSQCGWGFLSEQLGPPPAPPVPWALLPDPERGQLGHFLDHSLQKCGKGRKLLSRVVFHELIRNVLINPLEVKGETPTPHPSLKGQS